MKEQQEYTRKHQSMLYTQEQVQQLVDQQYSQAHNEGVTKALDCMERLYGRVPVKLSGLDIFRLSGNS